MAYLKVKTLSPEMPKRQHPLTYFVNTKNVFFVIVNWDSKVVKSHHIIPHGHCDLLYKLTFGKLNVSYCRISVLQMITVLASVPDPMEVCILTLFLNMPQPRAPAEGKHSTF